MGNLRDKYTDEEWDSIKKQIETERKNGKPDDDFMRLMISDMNIIDLIKIKDFLSDYYSSIELRNINQWIKYKSSK